MTYTPKDNDTNMHDDHPIHHNALQGQITANKAIQDAIKTKTDKYPTPVAASEAMVLVKDTAGELTFTHSTSVLKGDKGEKGDKGSDGAIAHVKKEGGTAFSRGTIEFTGAGITVTDNPGGDKVNVEVAVPADEKGVYYVRWLDGDGSLVSDTIEFAGTAITSVEMVGDHARVTIDGGSGGSGSSELPLYFWPAGRYIGNIGTTKAARTDKFLGLELVYIPADTPINRFVLYPGTSSSKIRGMIYNCDPVTGHPTTLVLDAGIATGTAASTGAATYPAVSLTVSATLVKGWYWIGGYVGGTVTNCAWSNGPYVNSVGIGGLANYATSVSNSNDVGPQYSNYFAFFNSTAYADDTCATAAPSTLASLTPTYAQNGNAGTGNTPKWMIRHTPDAVPTAVAADIDITVNDYHSPTLGYTTATIGAALIDEPTSQNPLVGGPYNKIRVQADNYFDTYSGYHRIDVNYRNVDNTTSGSYSFSSNDGTLSTITQGDGSYIITAPAGCYIFLYSMIGRLDPANERLIAQWSYNSTYLSLITDSSQIVAQNY